MSKFSVINNAILLIFIGFIFWITHSLWSFLLLVFFIVPIKDE